MDINRAINFIETSFLSSLLKDPNITDISFNGKDIFYVHNLKGRQKFPVHVDVSKMNDFIRQLSNISEKFFSLSDPLLNLTVGRYRINAVHPSIARYKNDKSLTFSIRIGSLLPLNLDKSMLNKSMLSFFSYLLDKEKSIVIAGSTSSGKTELQKYLLTLLKKNSRVVVIDNILELNQSHFNDNLDINIWQVDEKNNKATMNELIKNALRSNPDWLIIAESRGEEMMDVLNSVMTGNPIITTLHAEDSINIIPRMVSMIMMNEKKLNPEDIKKDIKSHLHYYVYLKKDMSKEGNIKRYISEILYVDNDTERLIYESSVGFLYENMDEDLKNHLLKEKKA